MEFIKAQTVLGERIFRIRQNAQGTWIGAENAGGVLVVVSASKFKSIVIKRINDIIRKTGQPG